MLAWSASAVGTGANVLSAKSLHGAQGPWLLRVEHDGIMRECVLRAHRANHSHMRTGAAALRMAERYGLDAPRLIASDLDGRGSGTPATLETSVSGSSASPSKVSVERLRAAGSAIARVHKVRLEPQPDLPFKIRSLQGRLTRDDPLAMVRRWSALYRASSEIEQARVVEAVSELTRWTAEHARQVISLAHSTPLLQLADDRLREVPEPKGEKVFLHADLWAGNMMWDGDENVVLIDWKDAGVGDPGVDLGHLRMMMATQYGLNAAAHVLDGWQKESGREASSLAYWDTVAALHTPTDLDNWPPGFDERGDQLGTVALSQRRDAFLRAALDRL